MADDVLVKNTKPEKVGWLLVYIIALGLILFWGRSIFIPLSYAILISFIFYPVCRWLESKGIPRVIAIGILISALTLLIAYIFILLAGQLYQFISEWPDIRQKITASYSNLQVLIERKTNVSKAEQNRWIMDTFYTNSSDLIAGIRSFLYGSVVNLVLIILIPIFTVMLLLSRERSVKFLELSFAETNPSEIRKILHEIIHAYYYFIIGMGIVYLIVGILNSIGLYIIGIPHPFLFGFIASVLTFIPYVGIVIASLLPITVSWLEYDSYWYPLGVIVVFTFVQYLEANLIFPLAVSNKLDVNPMMTIIAILAGGIIWGASGMILFVPFLAILKLIAERSEKMKAISILLGNTK